MARMIFAMIAAVEIVVGQRREEVWQELDLHTSLRSTFQIAECEIPIDWKTNCEVQQVTSASTLSVQLKLKLQPHVPELQWSNTWHELMQPRHRHRLGMGYSCSVDA